MQRLDLVRVRDAGLSGADDDTILEWAAREGRILLTHDVNTMIARAYERMEAGRPMPGLIVACRRTGIGRIVEDVIIVVECSREGEIADRVLHLPL